MIPEKFKNLSAYTQLMTSLEFLRRTAETYVEFARGEQFSREKLKETGLERLYFAGETETDFDSVIREYEKTLDTIKEIRNFVEKEVKEY